MVLESSWAKIHRAKEHLDTFRLELAEIREPVLRAVAIQATPNLEAGYFDVRIVKAPDVPPRFSIIASDIVHNLRSSLDHAAYELTRRHPNGPYEGSQFPIVSKLTSLKDNRVFRETLACFTKKQRTVVKRHQPYLRMKHYNAQSPVKLGAEEILRLIAANAPLGWIRDLSNRDKHRLLVESLVVPANQQLVITSIRDCANITCEWVIVNALKEDAQIAIYRADFIGPSPQMNMDLSFDPEVIIESDREPTTFPHRANLVLDLMFGKTVQIIRELEKLL